MKHVRAILSGAACGLAALAYGAYAHLPADDLLRRKTEMLDVVVRVETSEGSGSGTVIHSGDDGVFILTNHHVLPPKDTSDPSIKVRSWIYPDATSPALPLSQEVEVAADDEAKDLSLLKISDPEWRSHFVAAFLPEADALSPAEPVIVVGAGLGDRVFATAGLISLTYTKPMAPGGPATTMLSAPTIFGNSGGAAFVERGGHYLMAGVPESIESAPHTGIPFPMPHMAHAITLGEVRAFLKRNGHADWVEKTRPQRAPRVEGGPA